MERNHIKLFLSRSACYHRQESAADLVRDRNGLRKEQVIVRIRL